MKQSSKTILVDFIRHGEPEGGDILRGQIDPSLTEFGWEQMRQASALTVEHRSTIATPPWTEILSSPLKRCRHFAERTAAALSFSASVDARWQEIDYGDWDGLPIDQWRQLAAAQFKAFRDDISALAPPNGEDFLSFRDRVLAAWNEIAAKPDGSHLLVVTHGGVLRVVLPSVLGMPLNRSFPLHIPFACLSRVRLTLDGGKQRASLVFHNAGERVVGVMDSG